MVAGGVNIFGTQRLPTYKLAVTSDRLLRARLGWSDSIVRQRGCPGWAYRPDTTFGDGTVGGLRSGNFAHAHCAVIVK